MRKLLRLILLPFYLLSCDTEPSFTLIGDLSNSDEAQIYLESRDNGEWISIDSTTIIGGNFQFEGKIEYPSAYYLRVNGKRGYKMLFLENQNITVSGSADTLFALKVSGSVTHSEYERYSSVLDDLFEKKTALYLEQKLALEVNHTDQLSEIEREQVMIKKSIENWKREFILNNGASFAVPLILRSLSTDLNADSLEVMIDQLDPILSKTKIVIELRESVKLMRLLEPGKAAPEFSQTDVGGSIVSLADVAGEGPVLLVFWASWCYPCRDVNSELAEIFKKYRGRGLKIIGISLDSGMDDWKRAISEDETEWIHVSDLKFWNNEVALLYNVSKIPSNFLLDKNGIIVGLNMRPDEADSMISVLIGN